MPRQRWLFTVPVRQGAPPTGGLSRVKRWPVVPIDVQPPPSASVADPHFMQERPLREGMGLYRLLAAGLCQPVEKGSHMAILCSCNARSQKTYKHRVPS